MSTKPSTGRVRATYEFIKRHRRKYSVQAMCRELDRAETLRREALEISRRTLGETDRYVLRFRFNLAVLNTRRSRYEEAEAEFLKALEIGERRYGSSSVWVLFASQNLGSIYRDQGRYEEAVAYLRKAVECSLLRSSGQNDPDTLDRKNNLAAALSRNGENSEAESLFNEVLEVARRDGDSEREARSHLRLAELELIRGNTALADSHAERFLEYLSGIGESNDFPALARYYVLVGNYEMAIRALSRDVEQGRPRSVIASDPDFASLRGYPEFEALVANSGR